MTFDQESTDSDSGAGKQVIVCICAMDKKSQSKPMREILTRLEEFEYIKTLVMTEEAILNDPVDKWPLCDCLISFHSKGFPLSKAIEYVQLRNPFVISDLHKQYDIQDRRKVSPLSFMKTLIINSPFRFIGHLKMRASSCRDTRSLTATRRSPRSGKSLKEMIK